MTSQRPRPSWWAVMASGLVGALLSVGVVVLTWGSTPEVQAASAVAAAPPPLPKVTFLGDSWTEGIGATALHGYAMLSGEQLGWEYDVLGVGGSGYSLRGRDGFGSTYAERIDRVVALDADVLVVQGSLNESYSTPEVLAPAAMDTLLRLRTGVAPETRVVVLGAPYNPGTPDATIDWINAAVEAAAANAGVRFVDVAAENWTDPADPAIWADPIHPNDAGHQLIADRLVPLLRALLDE